MPILYTLSNTCLHRNKTTDTKKRPVLHTCMAKFDILRGLP